MPWHLTASSHGERSLRALPASDRDVVRGALLRAADDPSAVDMKKLQGRGQLWRLRVGRWRALLELDNRTGEMTLVDVLPRDKAYRD